MSIGVITGTDKNGQTVEIVFESYYQDNKLKVFTFEGMQRDGSGRWATHEIIGQDKKPILEFIGPDLEKISFSVTLLAVLGVNPEEEIKKLRKIRDEGIVCDVMIGENPISTNQWVIPTISEAHKTYDNAGALLAASVNISLTEYVKMPTEGAGSSGT